MFEKMQHKKGNAPLYMLLLAIVVIVMAMLRQCSVKTLPQRHEPIAGGDTINVAIEISPVGVTLQRDTLSGTYYDMLADMAAAHGRPLKFHPFTQLQHALDGLDEGRYQIVVSDIPATTELKEKYLFVDPVAIDKQVLVQRRDTSGTIAIKSQVDLAHRRVNVPHGSPFISRLNNLAREIGDTIIVVEDPDYSTEQMIMLVALGELDNVVVNARTARHLLDKYPDLDASVGISFNQFQGWAISPRDTLLRDTLNAWLHALPSTSLP